MADTPFPGQRRPDADLGQRRLAPRAEALIVDVDGFEGPLDLLLTLARTQKVDLRKISILRWPSNTSPSSNRPRRCGSNWPPITW
jgi:hypothetical protein